MRRRTLIALVLLACALLAGCTAGDPSPTPPPGPSPSSSSATPAGPVTLRLGVYGDRAVRDAWRQVARVYGNARPQVTVEVEAQRTAEAAMTRRRSQLAEGSAPDVFLAPSEDAPTLSTADQVVPVDELLTARGVVFADTYLRLGLEAFSAEQHLQCMPVDVSPLVVVYNRDLLSLDRLREDGEEPVNPETGWSWAQFTRAARLMSHGGVKGVYVEPSLTPLLALVRSGGADLVDDPREATTLTFSDDGARAALEEVLDVLRETRLTPTPAQLARKDALTRFAEGRIGMLLATRAVVPRLRQTEVDFDVFPLPWLGRPRTVADVSGLCLTSDGGQVEAAADFLAWASGPKAMAILAQSGGVVPAHVPTLNSLAFTQPGELPETVRVFGDAIAVSTLHPYVVGWPEVVDGVAPHLQRLFYDPVVDLDTLLPRIDAMSQRVLAPVPEPTG